MSPLVVAARNIDIFNAGGDWNLALVQNSGRTPGFFVSDERLADTQFQRMREQLIERYTGSRNVGLPGLLEQGVKWVQNGMTPMDMDWSKLSLNQQRMFAITIGVPPEMLGDPEVKTYASYSEARASFYTETVLPLMDILRDEFNRWLVPMYDARLWLDYNTEDIEALAPMRAARWAQVNAATFLTVDEKREAVGYDALPNGLGKVIIVLNTNATLEAVVEAANALPVKPAESPEAVKPPGANVPGLPPGKDANDTDEGAPSPAPEGDNPGDSGVPDGGMGGAVNGGDKSYDPLDDILAGKVVRIRPKAAAPVVRRSISHRRDRNATG
jgi:hypothetical protein